MSSPTRDTRTKTMVSSPANLKRHSRHHLWATLRKRVRGRIRGSPFRPEEQWRGRRCWIFSRGSRWRRSRPEKRGKGCSEERGWEAEAMRVMEATGRSILEISNPNRQWENLPQFRMRLIPEGAITPFIRFCLKESLILLRRLCHKEMHQLWSKTSQKCPTLPSDQELRIFCQRDLRTSIKCPIRASTTTKLLKWLGYSHLETLPKDWIICYKSTDLKY